MPPAQFRRMRCRITVFGSVLAIVTLWNVAAHSAPGDVDPSFNPACNNPVQAIQIQSDGRILVGAYFTNVNGLSQTGIVRLWPDGSLDTSFVVDTGVSNAVNCIAVQPNQKIVIGGTFSTVNGINRSSLARLNPDGSLDLDFNPILGTNSTWEFPLIKSPAVDCLAIQPSGALLLVGNFSSINGTNRTNFARLNADGSFDSVFTPEVLSEPSDGSTPSGIECIVSQSDGRIIIGGTITSVNGTACTNIARLNVDGTVDTNFQILDLARDVQSLALQPDGKILIGAGTTDFFYGTYYFGVGRLDQNGNWDSSFDAGNEPGGVRSIALQPDGKVVICGSFTSVNGTRRERIARFNSDGSLDDGFDPLGGLAGDHNNPFPSGYTVALQTDGKVLVGGKFSYVNWVSHRNIVRFLGNGSPQFTSLKPKPDGSMELAGYAATNAHLRLAASTNLNDWSVVSEFTNSTGTFFLTNAPTGNSLAFYRLVWLP